MFLTPFHGLCMALADSVPGVSGGTVAFILGFYDRFIDALHALPGRDKAARRAALGYLARLGAGWAVGMAACILLLANLFAGHIYFMSSLFLGLTAASLPFVVQAERETLRGTWPQAVFAVLGCGVVVGLTLLRGTSGLSGVTMEGFRPLTLGYLFLCGAVAISAMVLPGISGSSVLLIAGAYLPAVQAVRGLLGLDLRGLPGLMALGLGVLCGIACSAGLIRQALQRHRSQMVWLILGLMAGSLYAIVQGPASLDPPQAAMTTGTFSLTGFALGAAALLGLEGLRRVTERRTAAC